MTDNTQATKLQYGRMIRVKVGGVQVDKLRMKVDLKNKADSNSPVGLVEIYNLSREKHQQIEKQGDRIIIEAGYKQAGGLSRIFEGFVKKVWKTRVDHAFLTRISLTDALRKETSKGRNIQIAEESTLLVKDLTRRIVVEKMGLQIGEISAIPPNVEYTNFQHDGDARRALDKLMRKVHDDTGIVVSVIIDDDTVKFMRGTGALEDGIKIVKTPRTGIIGVPEINEDNKLTTLVMLEPKAKVGGEIEIQKSDYISDGVFTITGVSHNFDNWQGPFQTRIEAVKEIEDGE